MQYSQAKNLVPANRRWCRWTSCIYLQRWRGVIRIRYGYRYRHSQVLATWYPSGRFKFVSQCYYPSQKNKISEFLPDGFQVFSHRYYSFLQRPGQYMEDARAFFIRQEGGRTNRYPSHPPSWCEIKDGKVLTRLGPTFQEIRNKLKRGDIARDIPRRRGRYWLRKARGVYRRHPCGKNYPSCNWKRLWPRPSTNWKGDCGCEVYTKKAISRHTVSSIMEEQNATVRTAMIQIYGIEKFFTDAGSKQIDEEAGYKLITLDTGRAHTLEPRRWGGDNQQTANVVLTALRMECSTTGKVYVNTVPPNMRTVRSALDWMYDTTNYLERVGVQT